MRVWEPLLPFSLHVKLGLSPSCPNVWPKTANVMTTNARQTPITRHCRALRGYDEWLGPVKLISGLLPGN